MTAGVRVTSKYNGIAGTHLGTYDPVYGGYAYYVPLVYADRGGVRQLDLHPERRAGVLVGRDLDEGAGRLPAGADLRGVDAGAGRDVSVRPERLRGARAGRAARGCAPAQPMGIAVDIVGRDMLMTYIGEPAELNYTFDPTQAVRRRRATRWHSGR